MVGVLNQEDGLSERLSSLKNFRRRKAILRGTVCNECLGYAFEGPQVLWVNSMIEQKASLQNVMDSYHPSKEARSQAKTSPKTCYAVFQGKKEGTTYRAWPLQAHSRLLT